MTRGARRRSSHNRRRRIRSRRRRRAQSCVQPGSGEAYQATQSNSLKPGGQRPEQVDRGSEGCASCGQSAFPMESVSADGARFHMRCFKCRNCHNLLGRAAWNRIQDRFYCNPCHRQVALQNLRSARLH